MSANPPIASLEAAKPLLIGVGNPYRRDDGVGIVVARLVRERSAEIDVIELSGEGAELLESWRSASRVVLVDAVRSGSSAGRVHRLDAGAQRIPSDFFNYSTHAFSVAEAVEMSRVLGTLPSRMVIFGIEGKDFAAGADLSPEVAAVVAEVVDRILEEIGVALHKVSHA